MLSQIDNILKAHGYEFAYTVNNKYFAIPSDNITSPKIVMDSLVIQLGGSLGKEHTFISQDNRVFEINFLEVTDDPVV